MIGGSGERYLLRAVAEHADWWLSYGDVPAIQERKLAALADHCRDVGRDPATIRKVVPVDGLPPSRPERRAALGGRRGRGRPAGLRRRPGRAARPDRRGGRARLRHDPAPVRRADGHDRHRAVRRRGAAPCPLTSARRVVPAAEFDLPAGHLDAPGLPAVRFPETGRPEADVLDDVRGRFDEDRFEPDKNFSITYSGIPSAISREVEALARGRFFVEWARETELGHVVDGARGRGDDGVAARQRRRRGGFITTGGTESNLAAMRLARNTGRQAEPEIIAPVTMHFSFRLGAELMGIRLVEIDVDDETYLPRIEDVERAITPRTVGLVCSAPGGSFGVLDPVEAFADLARRTGLYLHVDARVRRVHPAVHARPRARDPAVRPVARRRQLDLDRRPQAGPAADRDRLLPGQGRGHPRGDPDRADADPHDVVDEARQPGGGRVGHAQAPRPGGLRPVHGARPGPAPTSSPRASPRSPA